MVSALGEMNKLLTFIFPIFIFQFFGCTTMNEMSQDELATIKSSIHQSAACKLCGVSKPSNNVLAEIRKRGIECSNLSQDDCVWRNAKGEKKGEYSINSKCYSGCDCGSGYCGPMYDGVDCEILAYAPTVCIESPKNFCSKEGKYVFEPFLTSTCWVE